METYIKSPLEVTEDRLVWTASKQFNLSRDEASHLRIQRCEVGAEVREQAERLLGTWEGTAEQIKAAQRLYLTKNWLLAHK